jgi:hypothetical protein
VYSVNASDLEGDEGLLVKAMLKAIRVDLATTPIHERDLGAANAVVVAAAPIGLVICKPDPSHPQGKWSATVTPWRQISGLEIEADMTPQTTSSGEAAKALATVTLYLGLPNLDRLPLSQSSEEPVKGSIGAEIVRYAMEAAP